MSKIVLKIDECGDLVSIYSTDKNTQVEIYNYKESICYGDANELEMDTEFDEETDGLYEVYNANEEEEFI